jgi:hypothetical protein
MIYAGKAGRRGRGEGHGLMLVRGDESFTGMLPALPASTPPLSISMV